MYCHTDSYPYYINVLSYRLIPTLDTCTLTILTQFLTSSSSSSSSYRPLRGSRNEADNPL